MFCLYWTSTIQVEICLTLFKMCESPVQQQSYNIILDQCWAWIWSDKDGYIYVVRKCNVSLGESEWMVVCACNTGQPNNCDLGINIGLVQLWAPMNVIWVALLTNTTPGSSCTVRQAWMSALIHDQIITFVNSILISRQSWHISTTTWVQIPYPQTHGLHVRMGNPHQ